MKWIYLPWKYRSADTATKICNVILYLAGCLLIVSLLTMGYQMFHVHSLQGQERHAQATRTTKEVPVSIDHRQYDYVYHTNAQPYRATGDAINNVIQAVNKHDMSSYTDRVYWLKDHIDQGVLSDNTTPLTNQKLDLKHTFVGFDLNDNDQKNVHFIVKSLDDSQSDGTPDDQVPPVLISGTFDGTTQKITSLQKTNE